MAPGRAKFVIKKTEVPIPSSQGSGAPLPKPLAQSKSPNEGTLPSESALTPILNGTINKDSSGNAAASTMARPASGAVDSVSKPSSESSRHTPIGAQSSPRATETSPRLSSRSSLQIDGSFTASSKPSSSSPASTPTVNGKMPNLRKRALDSPMRDSTPRSRKKIKTTINVEIASKLSAALNISKDSQSIWSGNALKTARLRSQKFQVAFDAKSPFDSLSKVDSNTKGTIKLNKVKKANKERFEPIPKSDMKMAKSVYSAAVNKVPKFKHYTAVSQSVMAPERQEIRVIPEVDQADNNKQDDLEEELANNYGDLTEQRARELKQRHLRANLVRPVAGFLLEIGLEVDDILRYLLEPTIADFPKHLLDQRSPLFNVPKPDRDLDVADALMRSRIAIGKLMTSDLIQLIHDACVAIHEAVPELNVLELMRTIHQEQSNQSHAEKQSMRLKGYTCRICFQENCLLHGAFFDDENDDVYQARYLSAETPLPILSSIQQGETFATVMEFNVYGFDEHDRLERPPYKSEIFSDRESCSDDCFWKKPNRQLPNSAIWTDKEQDRLEELLRIYAKDLRAPCAIGTFLETKTCIEIAHKATEMIQRKCDSSGTGQAADTRVDKRHAKLIRRIGRAHQLHQRHLYSPCSHTGSCEEAQCSCWENEVLCEKFCMCPPECERRVQGCQCKRSGNICGTAQCPCFRMSRECDPDLCGSCGAHEALDPARKCEPGILRDRCRNVPNQLNISKKTYMGAAQFGFGLFMGEPVVKDEYVSEYKGEVICRAEAERRGLTAAYMRNQYLFSINLDVDNDATYAGNKTRHINHSSDTRNINVYVRMSLCAGVTRLGMFASRDISVGEELLFNYGYIEKDLNSFYEKGGNRSIEVAKGLKGVKAPDKSVGRQRTGTGVPMAAAKSFCVDGYTAEQLYSGLDSSQPDPEDDFATIPIPPDDESDLDFVNKTSPRKGFESSDADTPRRQTRRRNALQ